MKIKDIQKDSKERKTIPIAIRTYPKYSKFMKENNISPNALFNEAIKELIKEKWLE